MTTIFAPITSTLSSAICVLRISGPKSLFCLEKLGVKAKFLPNQIKFAKIYDLSENNSLIDEVLIAYFKAPQSFTGEDVVEISIHNSPFILKKICEILSLIENVRFAQAGEFSKIAFLNNKIDLVQAEAIVDLIKSQTEKQHNQALRQLQGEIGEIYENWRTQIIEILSLIESAIDFSEEDLPAQIVDEAVKKVGNLQKEIKNHLDDNKNGQKIKDGLSLVIIGAPNVGKSSLINFLAKSEVAIVSEIAGTTRDVIEIYLDIAGFAVKISDTAGIHETKDAIEQEGIKRALKKSENADIKILLFDKNNQDEIVEIQENKNYIKVLNKVDLIDENDEINFKKYDLIISLKDKKNLDLLFKKIEEKIKEIIPDQNEIFITQERYRICLEKASNSLLEFCLNKNIEIAAEDLRIAGNEIAKITGRINVDDILDVVFSRFCIGK